MYGDDTRRRQSSVVGKELALNKRATALDIVFPAAFLEWYCMRGHPASQIERSEPSA